MRLRPASFPVTEAAVRHNTGDDEAKVLDLVRIAVVRRSSGDKEYHVLSRNGRESLAAIIAILEAGNAIRDDMEGLRG